MKGSENRRSLLDRVFPFHFALDAPGRFVDAGPRFRAFAGDEIDSCRFFDLEAIEGPHRIRDFASLARTDGEVNVVVLPFLRGIRLRGEFMVDVDSDEMIRFFGHPWLTDIGSLESLNLDLNDFPPHSGLSDMLVNLQLRESVNRDLKRLADSLRDRSRDLEAELEKREALEARLQQSQKMEALGRLAGGVAHDFNNALTAISGHASLGRMSEDLDDAHRHLGLISDATRRATDITGRLLTFARRKRIEIQESPVQVILDETAAMLEPLIGVEFTLQFKCDPEVSQVRTDPAAFQQALVNLVVNARDASKPGSVIVLHARYEQDDQPRSMMGMERQPGAWVVFEVRDEGHGMNAEVRDRIFEPFFTTKDLGEGTGLGLSTVWWIIERSGGAMEVDSQPGHGTCFRLHLPAGSMETLPLAASDAEHQGQGRRILYVETDAVARNATAELLRAAGWQVEESSSAEEAISLADRSLQPFDVLISALVMEAMNGRELAQVMRTRQPWLRVVMVTAYDVGSREGFGEDQVLSKPFDLPELLRAIQVRTPRD
ncbi:MAG: hypothetical protein CMJ23_06035 [Phycisphaerae bacterium]|nr:hypothetical protein [Phycisphaerae bacterium]